MRQARRVEQRGAGNGGGPVRRRPRGIYLLPNLFTTAGLFAGFYAIIAAIGGRFYAAAVAVFVAMVMDGIDGRVARLTHTESDFGKEYDSLSDMVCFGLAPALVMYEWSLSSLSGMGLLWGRLGWITAFVYAVGAALRLARFNTSVGKVDRRYFQGLPSPSAAAVVAGMVWLGADLGIPGHSVAIPAMLLTLAAGLLMVSNFRYYSFKEIDFSNPVPFAAILVMVFVISLLLTDPPKLLFGGFTLYACSGPVLTLVQRRRIRRRKQAISGGRKGG
ncbi:MAG: CDP-diacylglycerol--serine O-phosphatidyltransferase [Gammaproteobacteria bacterium]|nr:MAG: CDP-diacylglycerol--serine O-phosphatidyltransferase [Gammaproteobacteria bacterium]